MNKLCFFIGMIITSGICNAQIDLQCSGRDKSSIYISGYTAEIYRIDSVDTNPTNPILVASNLPSPSGGISINANLDSLSGPETMYLIDSGQPYYFWNGTGWTNTNHLSGSSTAVNPGGTGNYIFNLDGVGHSLYRYDGTANGTLLLTNLNTGTGFWDIATDQMGNFYLISGGTPEIVVFNPSGMAVDTFTTSGLTSNLGGGFAILGNHLYVVTLSDLFKGTRTGHNVDFTWIKDIGFSVNDIAACPEAAFPLSVSQYSSGLNSNVFPNPFNSTLNIFIGDHEDGELIIYDLVSKRLLLQKFAGAISLNTEQFANGIYLYEVRNQNGVIKKGKIVKD